MHCNPEDGPWRVSAVFLTNLVKKEPMCLFHIGSLGGPACEIDKIVDRYGAFCSLGEYQMGREQS